jgi:hypothetical protein
VPAIIRICLLRQRKELTRMNAARHEEVARALRRRFGQNRRLDLPEPLVVEVVSQRQRDAVAKPKVALQSRPPQIEVAILEPDLLGDVGVLRNGERRSLGLIQNANVARPHLHLAGWHARVGRLWRTPLHATFNGNDILRAQAFGAVEQFFGPFHDDLRVPVAVANIDKEQ